MKTVPSPINGPDTLPAGHTSKRSPAPTSAGATSPALGLPWHWFWLGIALLAGAWASWILWGPMPMAVPLPTTGGNSGEIILLKDVANAASPAALQHRQVQLVGRYKAEHTVVLSGRDMAGRSGFYVLTPLVERGDSGLAVLVQRAWVSASTPNLGSMLKTHTPLHDVVIHGRLAMPNLGLASTAATETGLIRKNLNLAAYANEIGLPMVPLVVLNEHEATTSAKDIRDSFFKLRWPELYPQDKPTVRNGRAALGAAGGFVLVSLWVWRRRQRRRQAPSEPDWASTL